jgi:hypothetical protein
MSVDSLLPDMLPGGLTARVTGGWRDETRSRNGQNPKPRKKPKNGANPAVRVHALLGSASMFGFNIGLQTLTKLSAPHIVV